MLMRAETVTYAGRISVGKVSFPMRLALSTRTFVPRPSVSAKALHDTMPTSMSITTSWAPWSGRQVAFMTYWKTNM